MSQRAVSRIATLVGVCTFVSIMMFSLWLATVPLYTDIYGDCLAEEACYRRTVSEDICLAGMIQRCSWVTLLAYLTLYVLMSYAIAVVVERWLTYYYAERQTREFRSKVTDAIYCNHLDEARDLTDRFPQSPLAVVVSAALPRSRHAGNWTTTDGPPCMEARHQAIVIQSEQLKRGLWSLSAAGWTVPLVSLFIFAAGMIHGLQGSIYAESRLGFLSHCISQTLWTTIFSVLISIPLIWFHKSFDARSERLLTQMDRLSLAIIGQMAGPAKTLITSGAVNHYETQPLDIRVTRRLRD